MHSQRTSIRGRELPVSLRTSVCFVTAVCLAMCGGLRQAWASPATTTVLAIASSGSVVTTATAGSVVTHTATVNAGSGVVTPGQVNFCDATAKYCTDIHLLGTVQLTGAGTATLRFRPGIGSHSYKAVFLGTTSAAASASADAALAVTAIGGVLPSITTIASSGSQGGYTLTATASGNISVAPTGTVSFVDMSNANALLGTAALTPSTAGLIFIRSSLLFYAPTLVATGDFNGDGIADLVAISNLSGGFGILLGNGDGTFKDAATSVAAAHANGVVVGDFNGDGKLDLATVFGSTVTIFLGNGDGTFTSGYQSPQTVAASAIAVGDFNGDGNLDLAVSNQQGDSVSILLGNGDGTFTVGATAPTGATPGPIAVGDFNGDGKLDLAVGNQQGDSLSILLGNGDGTFTVGATVATTAGPNAMAVADFNGDGKADLAMEANGTVTVLLGNGDGTFTGAAPATGYAGTAVVVGDFNGDGIVDLAVAGYNDPVLLGNGDGTFTTVISTEEVIESGSIAVVADFDGDGTSDLVGVILGDDADTITVSLSQPTFSTATVNNVVILPVGANASYHEVDASYPGDARYGSSVSNLIGLPPQPSILPPQPLISIDLTSVPPIMFGTSATSTVTITPNQGFTGTVALTCGIGGFSSNSIPTCSITPSVALSGTTAVSATATISTQTTTPGGAYQIGVQGEAGGQVYSSNLLTFTVAAPPNITLMGFPLILASPGASGTSAVTIFPSGGFTGTVALTCAVTNSPAGAVDLPTCSVTAPAAISGTTSVTATLTINTTPASSAALHDPMRRTFQVGGGVAMVAALLFFSVPGRRRRLKTLLGLLLFAAVAGADIGCSSAVNNKPTTPANPGAPNTTPGTTPGSYTVTVTGTSGATTATIPVSITVN
jgi:hypothetical protein